MKWQDTARALMKRQNLTQDDLMGVLGVDTKGAVSHYFTGRRQLSIEQFANLAKKLNVTSSELMGEVELGSLDNSISEPRVVYGQVPLVSWAQAGVWSSTFDPFPLGDAEKWLPCPVKHSAGTYVLRVRGDSMSPEYRDGELIFVDPSRDPVHGDDVIVRLIDRDETTFKQYRREGGVAYLRPYNRDWPEQFIEVTEKAYFKGVVIFSGRER